MKNTTKGALAAVTAAALLTGGAGSLAFWNDTATVNGGAITSGLLTLDDGACDSVWTYNNGTRAGQTIGLVVPGDAVTKTCRFVIGARGTNLSAAPTVPATVAYTASKAAPSLTLPVTATYAVGPAAGTTTPVTAASVITEANDGQTLTAKIVVTMPFGNAPGSATPVNVNDTQSLTATLNALTVALTQTQNDANPNS